MRPGPRNRIRYEAAPVPSTIGERLREACEMHEVAIAQLVARLRRTTPGITEQELDEAVCAWLAGGDLGPGRVREWKG